MKYIFYSLSFVLFNFHASAQNKSGTKLSSHTPFILGQIDQIFSTELGEKRILNIYLPDGYNAKDTTRYPVVYLLDGSAEEDFIHVTGLYQFNSFPWINRVPKSIIVGIANTDRKRDFTFPTSIQTEKKRYPTTGGSSKFIAFLKNELQPYIGSHYRTDTSNTIIGESLGGLLSTEILFKYPALFDKYIIISPSVWWDEGSVLNFDSTALGRLNKPISIYIAVGKEGLTPSEKPRVMEVDANLLTEKIQAINNKMIHVYFDYLPQEDHATISHQGIFNALKLFSTVKEKTL